MLRFTKTVIRRATDGSEIRIPEGSLVVKDEDGWRFLSPHALITQKLALDVLLDGCTIRLRQAALPIQTPEQENKVLVFKRKGTALFVTLQSKSVDVTSASKAFISNVSVQKGLERNVQYAAIPVKATPTILVISRKLPVVWEQVPTLIYSHNKDTFYGLEFTTKNEFDTTVAALSKIVSNNSKLVKRINWGVKKYRLTFQLWFKKSSKSEQQ